ATRQALDRVYFSVDSATEALHDAVRGAGSFQRILTAAELCRSNDLPFSFLVVLNQKNYHEIAALSSRPMELGAVSIHFGHMLPPSEQIDRQLSLSCEARRAAELEVEKLNSTLGIDVLFSASRSNEGPGACCEPFGGRLASIDSRGRLSLCCQLADYRGL